jgi:two-component system, sensor histidine kinase and response regulator
MLNAFINKMIGDANMPLSQRIFHVYTLMTAIGCLILFVIDGIQLDTAEIRFPLIEAGLSLGALGLYMLSFSANRFALARFLCYIVNPFILLTIWYYMGGTDHFFSVVFIFITCFFVFIAPEQHKFKMVFGGLLFYYLLVAIEIYVPNCTLPSLEGNAELINNTAAFTVTLASFLVAISVISDSFIHFKAQSERDHKDIEALSAIQTQMISIISHDVRAPLGNIYILLGMINNGSVESKKQPQAIKQIMKNVMSSREVLESMVGWTRAQIQQINDGDMEVQFTTPALPAEIIENNIGDWRDIAANKQVEIAYLIHCKTNTRIAADNNLLRTVLRNIVLNAVKYTKPKGTVQVTVMNVNHYVVITVVDNGIGMSPERTAQLFKGKLNSNKGTEDERGSGIGLFIVHDMLQRVGAKIEVKSELGKGSVFTITFQEYLN